MFNALRYTILAFIIGVFVVSLVLTLYMSTMYATLSANDATFLTASFSTFVSLGSLVDVIRMTRRK